MNEEEALVCSYYVCSYLPKTQRSGSSNLNYREQFIIFGRRGGVSKEKVIYAFTKDRAIECKMP